MEYIRTEYNLHSQIKASEIESGKIYVTSLKYKLEKTPPGWMTFLTVIEFNLVSMTNSHCFEHSTCMDSRIHDKLTLFWTFNLYGFKCNCFIHMDSSYTYGNQVQPFLIKLPESMLDTELFFSPEIVNVSMLDELFFLLKSCVYTNVSHVHHAYGQDLLNDQWLIPPHIGIITNFLVIL